MNEQELLPLAELAKRLPSVRGKSIHRATVYRWAAKGLKSRAGQCVRLETKFVGGTLCASLDDANRFFDELDDLDWKPTPYRNRREEDRMRREGRAAILMALATQPALFIISIYAFRFFSA